MPAGLGLKAVWYGAETFGKLVGLSKGAAPASNSARPPAAALSRQQAIDSIRQDYDKNYFVGGQGASLDAYDPQCEFADPFVSFKGVGRFLQNVGNLGGLM